MPQTLSELLRAPLKSSPTLRFTAGSTLASGTMMIVQNTFGVLLKDTTNGANGVLITGTDSQGMPLPRDTSIFNVGQDVFFDADGDQRNGPSGVGAITTDPVLGNILIGKALENSTTSKDSIRVWLIPQPNRAVLGYTRFIANLAQTGTSSPVETILLDDTGLGLFNFNRIGVGIYTANVAGNFGARTHAFITPSNTLNSGGSLRHLGVRVEQTVPGIIFTVVINTWDETFTLADAVMDEVLPTIEVRIVNA